MSSEATETIGVDLGGTKVQVGVLAGVETLWESREGSREQSQDELVDLIVREIEAAREAHPAQQINHHVAPCLAQLVEVGLLDTRIRGTRPRSASFLF